MACGTTGARGLNLTDDAFWPAHMLRLGGLSWVLGVPIVGCFTGRAHHSVVVLERWGGGLRHNWGTGLEPHRRRISAQAHAEAGGLVLGFGRVNCCMLHWEGTSFSCSARAVGLWRFHSVFRKCPSSIMIFSHLAVSVAVPFGVSENS